MNRDSTHDQNLKIVLKLSPLEIKNRLEIADYKDPDYIASEVLVSLLRMHHGERTGVLGLIVDILYKRLTKFVGQYIHKNPSWYALLNASSETHLETVSYAWEKLLLDESPVSLAEVRFVKWVKARAIDYYRSQLTDKVKILTNNRVVPKDQDGNEISVDQLSVYDHEDEPDHVLERCNLAVDVKLAMFGMEPQMREVVHYRVECALEWKTIQQKVGISIPTARNLFKQGVERLFEVVNG